MASKEDLFNLTDELTNKYEARKAQAEDNQVSLLRRAFANSSVAILAGKGLSLEEMQAQAFQEPGFISKVLESFTTMALDLPVMATGGIAGSVAGPYGSAAAAFALPTAIKASYFNYVQRQAEEGRDISFSDFVSIGKETAIDAGVGAALGWLNAPLKAGSKFNRLDYLMRQNKALKAIAKTPLQKESAKLLLESGVLETGTTIPRGEKPSFEGFMLQLAPLGGWKLGGKIIPKLFKEHLQTGKSAEELLAEERNRNPKAADALAEGMREIGIKEIREQPGERKAETPTIEAEKALGEGERRALGKVNPTEEKPKEGVAPLEVEEAKTKKKSPSSKKKKETSKVKEEPKVETAPKETFESQAIKEPVKEPLTEKKRIRSAKAPLRKKQETDLVAPPPAALKGSTFYAKDVKGQNVKLQFENSLDKALHAVHSNNLPAKHPMFRFAAQTLKKKGLAHAAADVRAAAKFANESVIIPMSRGANKNSITIPSISDGKARATVINTKKAKKTGKTLSDRATPRVNGQPVSSKNLINLISNIVNVPIRVGVSGKGVKGIFDPGQKVIRIKKIGDVQTTFHELGHQMDLFFFAKDPRYAIGSYEELKPFASELTAIASPSLPLQDALSEGFAEGFKYWMDNPLAAAEKLPGFVDYIETKLKENAPDALHRLRIIQQAWQDYKAQNPLEAGKAEIKSTFEPTNDKRWDASDVRNNVNQARSWFIENIIDPYLGVKDISDSSYQMLRMLKGVPDEIRYYLEKGRYQWNDDNKSHIGKALLDIIDPLLRDPDMYQAAEVFLKSRTILETQTHKIKKKVSDRYNKKIKDADTKRAKTKLQIRKTKATANALKKFRDTEEYKTHTSRVDEALKRYPKLDQFANEWDAAARDILEFARDAELITQKDYENISAVHHMYAPLNRVIEHMDQKKGGGYTGGGRLTPFKSRSNPLSLYDTYSPIESLIGNVSTMIKRARENEAKKTFMNDAANHPFMGVKIEQLDPESRMKFSVSSIKEKLKDLGVNENIFEDLNPDLLASMLERSWDEASDRIYWRDGGELRTALISPNLKRAFDGVAPKEYSLLTRMMQGIGASLRAGATMSPVFTVKSLIRDPLHALITTQYGITVPDMINAAFHIYGKTDAYWKFKGSGAGHSTMASLSRLNMNKQLRRMAAAKQSGQLKSIREQTVEAGKTIFEWFTSINEAVEEIPRVAEFLKGVEQGADIRDAAFAAREVTLDFAHKAYVMQLWNSLVPFSNALVRANEQFVRLLYTEPKKAYQEGGDLKKAMGPWVKTLAYIGVPTAALAAMNTGQQWYEDLPDWEKFHFWHIKVGKHIARIPKPQEFGYWIGNSIQSVADYLHNEDPEVFKKWITQNIEGVVTTRLIQPPAIAAPVEIWANKSFFFGGPIIPQAKLGLLPQYQTGHRTTQLFETLSRKLADIFGVQVSPTVPEHFIDSWTGTLGREVLRGVDLIFRKTGLLEDPPQPKKGLEDYWLIGSFLSRYPSMNAQPIRDFFDFYKTDDQVARTIKYLLKDGKEDDAAKIQKLYGGVKAKKSYNAIINQMRAIRAIKANPELAPEQKQQLIDQITLQMIEVARYANKDIKERKKSLGV